jgi:hypothetical protein
MNFFLQDTALLKLRRTSQTVFCQFALSLNPIDGRGALHFYAIGKIVIILQSTSSDNIFYTLQRVCKPVFVCILNNPKICFTRLESEA